MTDRTYLIESAYQILHGLVPDFGSEEHHGHV